MSTQQSKHRFYVWLVLFVLLLAGLFATVFLVQQSQDIRNRAATPGGEVTVMLEPGSSTLEADQTHDIQIRLDTRGAAIDGVQVIVTLRAFGVAGSPTISFVPQIPDGLRIATESFVYDQQQDLYELRLGFITADPQQSFTTTGAVSVGRFTLNLPDNASLTARFDSSLSRAARHGQAVDTLAFTAAQTYSFVTGTGETGIGGACTLPQPPSNVTAFTGDSGVVNVRWDAASGVDHYIVNWGTAPGEYLVGNPNVGFVSGYSITGLQPDTDYYIGVAAVNSCATSYFVEDSATAGGVQTPSVDKGGVPVSTAPTVTPTPTVVPVSEFTPVATAPATPTPATLRPIPPPTPVVDEPEDSSLLDFDGSIVFLLGVVGFVLFIAILVHRRKSRWQSPTHTKPQTPPSDQSPPPMVNQ